MKELIKRKKELLEAEHELKLKRIALQQARQEARNTVVKPGRVLRVRVETWNLIRKNLHAHERIADTVHRLIAKGLK